MVRRVTEVGGSDKNKPFNWKESYESGNNSNHFANPRAARRVADVGIQLVVGLCSWRDSGPAPGHRDHPGPVGTTVNSGEKPARAFRAPAPHLRRKQT